MRISPRRYGDRTLSTGHDAAIPERRAGMPWEGLESGAPAAFRGRPAETARSRYTPVDDLGRQVAAALCAQLVGCGAVGMLEVLRFGLIPLSQEPRVELSSLSCRLD